MASVWVARTHGGSEQRLVAVKAMLPDLARHSDFRSMFLEEGQIVRAIDHPNVVKVHEVGEEQGVLYMAMDWVEGDSLRAVIREARRRRPIPAEMAVKIIAETAAGLHAAHELRGWDGELRNLVHCDVSPHNILVGLDGCARLVDFGVANATIHSDIGSAEKLKGKVAYMSPEQARGEKPDRRSDVFSLGVVLYELTTGERLFHGDNPAHTLHLINEGPIPDPRQGLPRYPDRLAQIVKKALERDVSRRYQTAEELREALDRFLVEERILVSPAGVGRLVSRVLGARIEQLRQSLSEALVAQDGLLRGDLIPEIPATSASSSGLSQNLLFLGPAPGSDPLSGRSGTPEPQTYDQPRPTHGLAPLFAALGGIAAATSSIVWALNQPPAGGPIGVAEPTTAVPVAQPDASQAARVEIQEEATGVDVSSIPLVPDQAQQRAPSSVRAPPKNVRGQPPKPSAVNLEEQPAESPSGLDGASRAVAASSVKLDQTPDDKVPAGERAPFNRGAAMAQLGSASRRAAGCKRPGGPTGPGYCSVTFPPEGGLPRVAMGAPFAGTAVGACITEAFQGARVPAYSGSPVSLPGSFRIPN